MTAEEGGYLGVCLLKRVRLKKGKSEKESVYLRPFSFQAVQLTFLLLLSLWVDASTSRVTHTHKHLHAHTDGGDSLDFGGRSGKHPPSMKV